MPNFGECHEGLEAFRIAGLPPDFYYIPNFVSVEEEASILQKIPANRWTHLTHRRLQAIPSTLTKTNTLLAAPLPTYLVTPVVSRFKDLGIFDQTPHQQPNHVLVNEYRAGEGIMPHEDGDAYAPVVATVSLGAALCLDVLPKPGDGGEKEKDKENEQDGECDEYKVPMRILQEPRSLLITTGTAYRALMHGIAAIEVDEDLGMDTVANWDLLGDRRAVEEAGGRNVRGTRVSLTYRDVLKVSSAASKVLGGLGRR
ncbi:alkB, alkylation repair protein 6 [Decorospora gaudefroyi]|uniref:AlkB, alkylation repair protein 6 n=1 Tax=Decorospora gaudefroyi TaxID=184978 RepID=A0A6A5K6L2_9PLEO|nr:alkB, alkylation repair protein 6 [Decorospora gaudefroyi]